MAVELDRHRTHVPIRGKGLTQAGLQRALPGAVAALASLVAALVVLEIWNTSLRVPMTLGSEDAVSVLLYMKTTLEQLWPVHNPLLGAPFGQDLQDYPLGDPAQIVLTKLIGIFTSDVALATNLFFLITFPLTAMSAVWALRRLGCSTWPAVACAILFALAPYHFLRGEDHLLIAAYYTVPFSCFLIVRQLAGEMPSLRTTVVLSALIGLAFTYYLIFTVILMAFAVLISLAARRRDQVRLGLVSIGVIGAFAVLAHTPTWIYHAKHGDNPVVDSLRASDQSERFGLKATRLILPVEGHRLAPLRDLTDDVQARAPSQLQEGPAQALGLMGAVAFLWLLWISLSGLVRPLRDFEAEPYLKSTAAATLTTSILGVAGGASLVIAYVGSPLIRSWSRLSILLLFFALIVVARVLARGSELLRERGIRPAIIGLALVAVVALGVADQTTTRMVPEYNDLKAEWRADAAFAQAAAEKLPSDSMVFQLPYAAYPETFYQSARPYLHTDRLRWTFGAMAGRPADWTAALAFEPMDFVLRAAAASGARAVHLDRAQYPGQQGAKTATALTKALGAPIAVDSTREQELYDLRPYTAELRRKLGPARFAELKRRVLHPVQVMPGPSLSTPQEHRDTLRRNRLSYGNRAYIELINPLDAPRTIQLEIAISAPVSPSVFDLLLPGGERQTFTTNPDASVAGELTLQPGTTRVTLVDRSEAPPWSNIFFSLQSVSVTDVVARQIAKSA